MIKYENECVGCPTEMGCIGSACRYMNVPHYYCDECGYEADELYEYYGDELCLYCLDKIAEEDFKEMSKEDRVELVLKGYISKVDP